MSWKEVVESYFDGADIGFVYVKFNINVLGWPRLYVRDFSCQGIKSQVKFSCPAGLVVLWVYKCDVGNGKVVWEYIIENIWVLFLWCRFIQAMLLYECIFKSVMWAMPWAGQGRMRVCAPLLALHLTLYSYNVAIGVALSNATTGVTWGLHKILLFTAISTEGALSVALPRDFQSILPILSLIAFSDASQSAFFVFVAV